MKKSELRKLIREILKEQMPNPGVARDIPEPKLPSAVERSKIIMNPKPSDLQKHGITQSEYNSVLKKLMKAKKRINENKMSLNEKKKWWQCGNCGGAKFGACLGASNGCLEPLKNGVKLTINF